MARSTADACRGRGFVAGGGRGQGIMARSIADAGKGRGFVAGGGRGQGAVADQYGGGSFDKRYAGRSNANTVIEENMAATREVGNSKRTGQQQGQYGGGSCAKKKLSGGNVTKLSVSSIPKTITKEDIRHAFEEHEHVEVALVKNKRIGPQQDIKGRTTTNIGKGSGRGVDRSSGEQGRSQGSVLGSTDTVGLKSNQQDTLMSSPIEGSDGDDVSSCRVASTKRGGSSQVQVPEPVNREWICIIDGEFSNQLASTRIIGVNLKGMWSGSWQNWKDVPNEDKKRLFERFQCYFQLEEKWNGEIYSCWERCIAGKIPDLLCRVRDRAKETARSKDVQVEDDMSVLTDFKPPWIKTETWKQMIEIWNTPEWKAEIIGREPSHSDMWKQTHLRKGSRPFDKDLDCSSSVIENVDLEDVELEENVQEKESAWVDDRAHETWVKYEGYHLEKYGEESSQQRELDKELWYRASGGKKRGKVYGLSNVKNDFNVQHHGKQDQEIERLNVIIQDIVKEKEEEKERYCGIGGGKRER